ncbi:hypothetical protein L1987_51282 [Smallanthus sonchifolius]|uniref:Uncharacterized protein n=1 Tax=Smallanthus sonchifolius TaxID=185202 RepID=A0ACB9EQ97_9ASTR|nr:hypothetical protein L1987_51282 [Smallanthus sonchifolius]
MDSTLTTAVVEEDFREAREAIEVEKPREMEVDNNGDIVREEEVSLMSVFEKNWVWRPMNRGLTATSKDHSYYLIIAKFVSCDIDID